MKIENPDDNEKKIEKPKKTNLDNVDKKSMGNKWKEVSENKDADNSEKKPDNKESKEESKEGSKEDSNENKEDTREDIIKKGKEAKELYEKTHDPQYKELVFELRGKLYALDKKDAGDNGDDENTEGNGDNVDGDDSNEDNDENTTEEDKNDKENIKERTKDDVKTELDEAIKKYNDSGDKKDLDSVLKLMEEFKNFDQKDNKKDEKEKEKDEEKERDEESKEDKKEDIEEDKNLDSESVDMDKMRENAKTQISKLYKERGEIDSPKLSDADYQEKCKKLGEIDKKIEKYQTIEKKTEVFKFEKSDDEEKTEIKKNAQSALAKYEKSGSKEDLEKVNGYERQLKSDGNDSKDKESNDRERTRYDDYTR